jgi:chromosomal replication initiator protein
MEVSANEEARALWGDVLSLLKESVSPPVLAMLNSCEPERLADGTYHIATKARFVKLKIEEHKNLIESCLKQVSFEDLHLVVDLTTDQNVRIKTNSEVTQKELTDWEHTQEQQGSVQHATQPQHCAPPMKPEESVPHTEDNPLLNNVTLNDSKLTFDRFVEGDENEMALQAAKQVADGENKNYNPLFIYGKSGLGKTHLLKAIQNYIYATQPQRSCVYKTGTEFIGDYVNAMRDRNSAVRTALERNCRAVDVLIIDDIQQMVGKEATINFFFDTFNYLTSHGRQIVLAADRSPAQLGLGEHALDERVTSRIGSGFTIGIEQPSYELKLKLINTFYRRMKSDAVQEHMEDMLSTISDENLRLMAEKSGNNIRVISGFVQSCLMLAHRKEQHSEHLTRDDVIQLADLKWPTGQKIVTIEQIQNAVETYYGVDHDDLIGSKRNKELMEPRHVAIWLSRELTDSTLQEIGQKFGGRSHATVKHSLKWVEASKKESRTFLQKLGTLQDQITE